MYIRYRVTPFTLYHFLKRNQITTKAPLDTPTLKLYHFLKRNQITTDVVDSLYCNVLYHFLKRNQITTMPALTA